MTNPLFNKEHEFADLDFSISNAKINIIMQAGFFDLGTPWISEPHCHSCFEIHYVEHGKVELNFFDKMVVLKESNTYIMPPQLYHHTGKTLIPTEKISFMFRIEKIKNEEDNNNIFDYYTSVYDKINNLMQISGECKYFKDIINCIKNLEVYDSNVIYKLKNLFSLAFMDTTENIAKKDRSQSVKSNKQNKVPNQLDDNIRRIKIESFIIKNYDKATTLEDIALYLNLSPRQADRIIRDIMGGNFKQLIIKHKMEMAKLLMKNSKLTLNEIAVRLGYDTYSGFYKTFKVHTEKTPQEYIMGL